EIGEDPQGALAAVLDRELELRQKGLDLRRRHPAAHLQPECLVAAFLEPFDHRRRLSLRSPGTGAAYPRRPAAGTRGARRSIPTRWLRPPGPCPCSSPSRRSRGAAALRRSLR